MSILTPKWGLVKPEYSDPASIVEAVSNNLDKLDAAVPKPLPITLPAALWNATTKTATIQVPGMRANMTGADFDVRYTKAAQYPALAMAGLGETDPAPGAGTITFTVAQGGIVPTISLDLAVIIYG
jgi:hypothetical protein